MKTKVKKELWLFNTTSSDVSISDLGVKVLAGESINVYVSNPYLTEEQVEKSMKYGALFKRLDGENPVLKIVQKKISGKTKIKKIQQSKEPINATKVRSTVIIDQKVDDQGDSGERFDFADYGFDPEISSPVKQDVGVVIKAKEDDLNKIEPIKDAPDSTKQTDPMGKMAQITIPSNSFVVVKNTVAETKAEQSTKELAKVVCEKTLVAEKTEEPLKSEELIAAKKECGVVIEKKAEVESAKKTEDGGMRVASRTKSGITVMKIKE